MKFVWGTVSCFLLLPVMTLAQSAPNPGSTPPVSDGGPVPSPNGPTVAAHGAVVNTSVGYAYLSLGIPSSSRVSLSGVDGAISADFTPRFGVTADLSYVRVADVFATGHHTDVLSYLGGPVLHLTRGRHLSTYVHVLVGGARVTGVTFLNSNSYVLGYANKFSWAVGAGAEYRVSPSFSFRGGGDFLHTSYFNPNLAIQGQDDFRTVVSVVYTLWQHRERRR